MTDLRVAPAGPQSARQPEPSERDRRFAALQHQVREAGLLETQPWYYALHIVLSLLLLAVGANAFVALGDSWWQLLVAVFLGACCTHVGFLGHDNGHRQVVRSRRGSRLLGLVVGNLVLGFSYGGFVQHHNKHHAYPNHVDRDPDIARRQVIHKPEFTPPSRVRHAILRHRKVFFLPLLVAESSALRVATIKAMKNRNPGATAIEVALIGLHFAVYITAVLLVLPPSKAFAFVLLQQAVFGLYTELVIAPNHKAMPLQLPAEERPWFEWQLITSRNLGQSRLTGFLFGGQNYHIEHHLFPTMPRNNARRAQPFVLAFCRHHGLPYHQVSVWASMVEMLGTFRRPSRAGAAAIP